MGGFHATLAPDEVAQHAEAVVIGEAETIWPEVIDDARSGRLQKRYRADSPPDLSLIRYDRSLFDGKRYLPVRLVETTRGCRFPCDFCAIQSFFDRTARHRPIADILADLGARGPAARFHFFVDDNFAADIEFAAELADAVAPLNLRWVTQMSINAAHDDALLARLKAAGCVGVLIGFETLDPKILRQMRKNFNAMKGGYRVALANLRYHGIRVYGTFVFGYGPYREEAFCEAAEFAIDERMYIAAFNHLTPFPGTPLFKRLRQEGRLLQEAWWLDPSYRYNDLPFRPDGAEPGDIRKGCLEARRRFYSWSSIAQRGMDRVNRADPIMARNFLPINLMHRFELSKRDRFPLGDPSFEGPMLCAH
jgi:radical SAM superfamily enzyme YgiQ (UPF0313 family)